MLKKFKSASKMIKVEAAENRNKNQNQNRQIKMDWCNKFFSCSSFFSFVAMKHVSSDAEMCDSMPFINEWLTAFAAPCTIYTYIICLRLCFCLYWRENKQNVQKRCWIDSTKRRNWKCVVSVCVIGMETMLEWYMKNENMSRWYIIIIVEIIIQFCVDQMIISCRLAIHICAHMQHVFNPNSQDEKRKTQTNMLDNNVISSTFDVCFTIDIYHDIHRSNADRLTMKNRAHLYASHTMRVYEHLYYIISAVCP